MMALLQQSICDTVLQGLSDCEVKEELEDISDVLDSLFRDVQSADTTSSLSWRKDVDQSQDKKLGSLLNSDDVVILDQKISTTNTGDSAEVQCEPLTVSHEQSVENSTVASSPSDPVDSVTCLLSCSDENPYTCPKCLISFSTHVDLADHVQLYHDNGENFELAMCSDASVQMTCTTDLPSEDDGHDDDEVLCDVILPEKFICSLCGKMLRSQKGLDGHLLVHDAVRPFVCCTCGEKFVTQLDLGVHERVHVLMMPFECRYCGKKFLKQPQLARHESYHLGIRRHKCETCGKRFLESGHLQVHTRVHTGERPYHCADCDRWFMWHGHYRRHLLMHQNIRPYKCSECGKDFVDATNFKAHVRCHLSVKEYKCYECKFCGKTFARDTNYYRHVEEHSEEARRYVCHLCNKRFKRAEHLQRHMDLHKNERLFACDRCGSRFNCKNGLNRHMRTGAHKKLYRKLEGKPRRQLEFRAVLPSTAIAIDKREFMCLECGKTFKLYWRLLAHSNSMSCAKTRSLMPDTVQLRHLTIRIVRMPEVEAAAAELVTVKNRTDASDINLIPMNGDGC